MIRLCQKYWPHQSNQDIPSKVNMYCNANNARVITCRNVQAPTLLPVLGLVHFYVLLPLQYWHYSTH